MKSSRPFRETQLEMLQDSELAALYLEEALANRDMELFKLALKNVAKARFGGMTALSKSTNITRESLYRALSAKGNPRLDTLTKVLHALGLRISVTPEVRWQNDSKFKAL